MCRPGPKERENLANLCASTLNARRSKVNLQFRGLAKLLISMMMAPLAPLLLLLVAPTAPFESDATTMLWMLRSCAKASASLHAIVSRISGSSTPWITRAELPRKLPLASQHTAAEEPPSPLRHAASTWIFANPRGGAFGRVAFIFAVGIRCSFCGQAGSAIIFSSCR